MLPAAANPMGSACCAACGLSCVQTACAGDDRVQRCSGCRDGRIDSGLRGPQHQVPGAPRCTGVSLVTVARPESDQGPQKTQKTKRCSEFDGDSRGKVPRPICDSRPRPMLRPRLALSDSAHARVHVAGNVPSVPASECASRAGALACGCGMCAECLGVDACLESVPCDVSSVHDMYDGASCARDVCVGGASSMHEDMVASRTCELYDDYELVCTGNETRAVSPSIRWLPSWRHGARKYLRERTLLGLYLVIHWSVWTRTTTGVMHTVQTTWSVTYTVPMTMHHMQGASTWVPRCAHPSLFVT